MSTLTRLKSFFLSLIGRSEPPSFDSLNGFFPYHPVVRWEQDGNGKTTLTLDADHLVLDGNRIDIAPADSPRRPRHQFFKHNLPRELGRWALPPKIPRVERLRRRRSLLLQKRVYLEQKRLYELALKNKDFDSMWLNE
jgi:hypothetical protein